MRLFPKEENFFDHFEELARKIEEGGQFFLEMTRKQHFSEARVSRLKELEHEADMIAHKTYKKMHQTYLTPIDRKDIYILVNTMDNILDIIEGTASRLQMYQVKKPHDQLIRQVQILDQAIAKVTKMIQGLRHKKNCRNVLNACVDVHTLENAGDDLLRDIITHLFDHEQDPFELVKWKEIFERMEAAIDACESVCNLVEGIVLKNA
jgi:uncharacterized protein